MKYKGKWILDSIQLARELILKQWLPLSVLFLISCLLNISAEDSLQAAGSSDETLRWVTQLGLGLWDLFEGILLLLILSWGIPQVRTLQGDALLSQPFQAPYLNSFLAEYLRVLARILMWGILLLLPGFVRYCQLIFVPLITLFSKAYQMGEVDALELSMRLAKGRLLMLIGALGVPMALQILVEFLPEMVPDLHTYTLRVVFALASFLFAILSYTLIYLLFEKWIEEEPSAGAN